MNAIAFLLIDLRRKVKYLGYKRNPEMSQETLFLKVMLDGENKFFRYRDNHLLKLYFKKGTDPISALIYKKVFEHFTKYC